MRLYSKYILPVLIQWACSNGSSDTKREAVVPMACGRVLEIGIGSGNNLPHYDKSKVSHLTALDPLEELWRKCRIDLSELGFEVKYLKGGAEEIPANNSTFDTVVSTFTLCSVNEPNSVLKEIHRVLKPGGRLIFSEHGKSPKKNVVRMQNMLNPLWRRVSGGCNLNRDIAALLEDNGFITIDLTTQYMPGWQLTSYSYWGSASRK
ncbi:MAG: class I SAM-dependent methyltransferase [Bacteroidota bacterium]|nr:class I SAM-dependent methyltransferase [Bacteroidota bacterium]